jgi:hypothetical protein
MRKSHKLGKSFAIKDDHHHEHQEHQHEKSNDNDEGSDSDKLMPCQGAIMHFEPHKVERFSLDITKDDLHKLIFKAI